MSILTRKSPSERIGLVTDYLLSLPEKIKKSRRAYLAADRAWQKRLAVTTCDALTAKVFTDAKTGELRAATNDMERNAAIARYIADDADLTNLAERREAFLLEYEFWKNQYDGARYAARLMARD